MQGFFTITGTVKIIQSLLASSLRQCCCLGLKPLALAGPSDHLHTVPLCSFAPLSAHSAFLALSAFLVAASCCTGPRESPDTPVSLSLLRPLGSFAPPDSISCLYSLSPLDEEPPLSPVWSTVSWAELTCLLTGAMNYVKVCHFKGCALLYTQFSGLQQDLYTGFPKLSFLPKLFGISKLKQYQNLKKVNKNSFLSSKSIFWSPAFCSCANPLCPFYFPFYSGRALYFFFIYIIYFFIIYNCIIKNPLPQLSILIVQKRPT